MNEEYEGREEENLPEDQPEDVDEDDYDGPWAIYLNKDPDLSWTETPHNSSALPSGLPHRGDAHVEADGRLVRAKGLVLSKCVNGFDGGAGAASRELLGNDVTLNFDEKNGNRVIGLNYKQVSVIVSNRKGNDVRLTTDKAITKGTKFRQFKGLYERSMEEFRSTSAGASKGAVSRVSGMSRVRSDTIYSTEREGKEVIGSRARDIARNLKSEFDDVDDVARFNEQEVREIGGLTEPISGNTEDREVIMSKIETLDAEVIEYRKRVIDNTGERTVVFKMAEEYVSFRSDYLRMRLAEVPRYPRPIRALEDVARENPLTYRDRFVRFLKNNSLGIGFGVFSTIARILE